MFQPKTLIAAVLVAAAGLCFNLPSCAATAETAPKTSARHKIDVNSASQQDLMELPGVGEVTAKKIISNRPYKSSQDLKKAGLSENEIHRIAGMVTVKAGSAASRTPRATSSERSRASTEGRRSTAAKRSEAAPVETQNRAEQSAAETHGTGATATGVQAPSSNQVWLNTETHVYHRAGSRWYGKTKSGKYVTEEEAVREGARPAENE